MSEGGGEPGSAGTSQPLARKKRISKKALAVLAVALLLGTSGFYVWYEYFRHWSISDLENAAIVGINEYDYPETFGFEHRLAGRTVTVEGTILWGTAINTTLGGLTIFGMEGGEFCQLMLWDSPLPEKGSRFELRVTFEWGTINGVDGVYSPQIAMPGYGIFASEQVMTQAISWIQGEIAIEMTDLGDDVVLKVDSSPEPVPLDMVRCELRAGIHSYTSEYIDLTGGYADCPVTDSMPDLGVGEGVNGTINFDDDDGYLDDGDTFTLRDLIRPDTESGGQTYLLRVTRDQYSFEEYDSPYADDEEVVLTVYIVMTKNGVLWVNGPGPGVEFALCTAHQATVPGGQSFTVDYVSGDLSWNRSHVFFFGNTSSASWSIPSGTLDSGSPETRSFGVMGLGDLRVEFSASDLTGNGLIDQGDWMEVVATDNTSFDVGERYEFRVVCEDTDSYGFSEPFLYRADPESECTVSAADGTTSVVFGPVHNGTGRDCEEVDVVWGEVLVTLESGGNVTEWYLATQNLTSDGGTSWVSGESSSGEMSLVCTVRDLQGNGVVNAGDSVEIEAVLPDDGFDPDAEYEISFTYLPTGATIYSITFTGAT